MFSDVIAFTGCDDVTDAKLINWIYWISGTSCNVNTMTLIHNAL